MKRMADASDNWTRGPYLTHSLSVNMRTFPSRGRIRLRVLIARSVENRQRALLVTGVKAAGEEVDDGKVGGPFWPGDIGTVSPVWGPLERIVG